jgi:hypothetical protein
LLATYELLDESDPAGRPLGRLDVTPVHKYALNTTSYKAVIAANDELEVYSSEREDCFVLALVKQKCAACNADTTGGQGRGAYMPPSPLPPHNHEPLAMPSLPEAALRPCAIPWARVVFIAFSSQRPTPPPRQAPTRACAKRATACSIITAWD